MRTHGITVVLVHSHRLVRAGLRSLLEHRGISVCAEAETYSEARAAVRTAQPDIVLADLAVSDESIVSVLPALLAAAPRSRVIGLTATRDARAHARAIEAGASGVVLLDHSADVLAAAVGAVARGECWTAPPVSAGVPPAPARRRVEIDPEVRKIQSLTRREREIVDHVGEGLKNRHIAGRLFISEATVRNHMTSVLDKLGLGDRFELAVYAFRHGLVSYPPPVIDALAAAADHPR